jgi:hypothetical protein
MNVEEGSAAPLPRLKAVRSAGNKLGFDELFHGPRPSCI